MGIVYVEAVEVVGLKSDRECSVDEDREP